MVIYHRRPAYGTSASLGGLSDEIMLDLGPPVPSESLAHHEPIDI
jgi:hypothetical protein